MLAITNKEVQQIQHDEKAHHQIKGALTKAEHLGGKKLAAFECTLGYFLAQPVDIAHAETVKPVLGGGRQDILELHDIAGDVDSAAFNILVERCHFLHQQGRGDDDRNDRDHRTGPQRGKSCQVASAF